MMAARASLSEGDLLCPICCEVFSVPVQLKCGHNFCKVCLQKRWKCKGCRECPRCRTTSTSERPPINLALKIAADYFQKQRTISENTEELCIWHKEKLQLFCQKDEELICLICQTSTRHRIHECCPVGEAALEKKKEVSANLETLQKQLKVLNKTKEQWEETKTYIKSQTDENEIAIKKEYGKLHQFLWEEEEATLIELREEEQKKIGVMLVKLESIENKIKDLSEIISDVEKAIRTKDIPFLQDYKNTKSRAKYNFVDPQCIRDILIDTAKHMGTLKFRTWRKMVKIIECAPITLDPNTAQSNLKFSEELTSVWYGSKRLLPDNPERCTSRISVLGATGFVSGKHSWTVEVGEGKDWYIGMATESIKRKNTIFLNPAEGFWVIGLCNGDTYWAQTTPRTKLVVKRKPQRVTVELDFDNGKVVFMNAIDLTPIYTFKDKFTERIFPYFSPGMYEDGKSSSPLIICSMPVSIDVRDQTKIGTVARRNTFLARKCNSNQ